MKIMLLLLLFSAFSYTDSSLIESVKLDEIGGEVIEYEEGNFDLAVPLSLRNCSLEAMNANLTDNKRILIFSSQLSNNKTKQDFQVSTIIYDPLGTYTLLISLVYRCEDSIKIFQLGSFAELIKQ
jgi:hypothetical protein